MDFAARQWPIQWSWSRCSANLAIASLAHSTELAGGFLGRPLVEVEEQGFFKGFRLAEFAKRETPYNARVVIFQACPNSHSFRGRGDHRQK
jgi:hypothetical protein